MGKIKKKYERGAATTYITRNSAIKKLQLTLADFRRLCILKGVYPQEPRHKKKVGRGSTAPKTYYHVKDIQFLLHEPLIAKFRELKHFNRRLKKAIQKRNINAATRIRSNKPKYTLDRIVKERYPSFTDAVRDLDDALTLCFTFANFPATKRTQVEMVHECRRLTVEFQQYVMASRSLRKVFYSIKGVYYQADISGETVTWIVPHKFGHEHPTDVDYKIMSTFIQFYTTMLKFINFKLFTSINLHYPPKLAVKLDEDGDEVTATREEKLEKLEALTHTLLSAGGDVVEEEAEPDRFEDGDNPDQVDQARVQLQELRDLTSLFASCKFFLSREVPRESFTFIIRAFGGQVSWDETVCGGATYQETDEGITHQIVDRPKLTSQHFNRSYVQPQWVLDSVNARRRLPVKDYVVGAALPPHLSPFVEEEEGEYVPPEKLKLLKRLQQEEEEVAAGDESDEAIEDEEDDDGGDDVEQSEDESEEDTENVVAAPATKRKRKLDKEPAVANKKAKHEVVTEGKREEVDVKKQLSRQQAEEQRLAELMIPKKHRRLYHKIQHKKKKISQEAEKLKEKREAIDKANRVQKKKQKHKPGVTA
ncbi:pescadillo homolog [Babylonia areolata]|uniref:pescadillo homolog n=1 Tax=Babylonia areolata TaxID=304850 RepID=UPI003FD5D576